MMTTSVAIDQNVKKILEADYRVKDIALADLGRREIKMAEIRNAGCLSVLKY